MRGGSQPASRQTPNEWLCIPKVEEGLGEECPPPPLLPGDSLGPERITHLSAALSKVEDEGDLMGWGWGLGLQNEGEGSQASCSPPSGPRCWCLRLAVSTPTLPASPAQQLTGPF